jgi:hypothetical protein
MQFWAEYLSKDKRFHEKLKTVIEAEPQGGCSAVIHLRCPPVEVFLISCYVSPFEPQPDGEIIDDLETAQ